MWISLNDRNGVPTVAIGEKIVSVDWLWWGHQSQHWIGDIRENGVNLFDCTGVLTGAIGYGV